MFDRPNPGPIDPPLVGVLRGQKSEVMDLEKATMAALVGLWLAMVARLTPAMDSLALELIGERSQGKTMAPEALLESQRYKNLVGLAKPELTGWAHQAEGEITGAQMTYGTKAQNDSLDALIYGAAFAGVALNPQPLPPVYLESMVGRAVAGVTIGDLLAPIPGEALGGLTQAVYSAAGPGGGGVMDPMALVRVMQNGFDFGLNRGLNSARSEPFRVYREITRLTWAASGRVKAYMRMATHDDRVCGGCLMSEGEIIPIGESLWDHPQGRCFMVPIITGAPKPTWLAGPNWFMAQDETTQKGILGPGRFDAWRAGQFKLGDLVTKKRDSVWGPTLQTTPLKKLVPGTAKTKPRG